MFHDTHFRNDGREREGGEGEQEIEWEENEE